jgi:amidophosphoribosyltransferase
MSDVIQHECGIAFIRLKKPLEYYVAHHGTGIYGLSKLYLLLEKQHNRGQDGAGIASVKLNPKPGKEYIDRRRSASPTPIKDTFEATFAELRNLAGGNNARLLDVNWLKENAPFTGEVFIGHVRYGTFGKNDIRFCHPFIMRSNWTTRSLTMAGNFNLTNVDELFRNLVALGQNPVETSDTITVLEKIGHFLNVENERILSKYREQGMSDVEMYSRVKEEICVSDILRNASKRWDGGYVMTGIFGHGDAFVLRDPNGIRPAFYYDDDTITVAASERAPLQTAFNLKYEQVHELPPGHALIVRSNGEVSIPEILAPREKKACSFERIYFSRGTDRDIYQERKNLGKQLAPAILKAIDFDLENTVFSYIPNTASVAFRGLAEELDVFCNKVKAERILQAGPALNEEKIKSILSLRPRIEKVAVKDVKLRTFITQDSDRDDLVTHVYDVTYGSVREGSDTLVIVDDSIVRGTTLRQSIIRILDRLGPKRIIIVSSAPQIRYPDCYGIDMTKISDFIAFRAAIELLHETHQQQIINEVYKRCKADAAVPKEESVNHVKAIYEPFSAEQISRKVAEFIKAPGIKAQIDVIYQSIGDLHHACPNNVGDWYFTGKYPTPGGNKVVNRSFVNYIEGRNERAY